MQHSAQTSMSTQMIDAEEKSANAAQEKEAARKTVLQNVYKVYLTVQIT